MRLSDETPVFADEAEGWIMKLMEMYRSTRYLPELQLTMLAAEGMYAICWGRGMSRGLVR